jgi:hypothetical protein
MDDIASGLRLRLLDMSVESEADETILLLVCFRTNFVRGEVSIQYMNWLTEIQQR